LTGQPLCWKPYWIITLVLIGLSGCAGWKGRERAPLGPMIPAVDRSATAAGPLARSSGAGPQSEPSRAVSGGGTSSASAAARFHMHDDGEAVHSGNSADPPLAFQDVPANGELGGMLPQRPAGPRPSPPSDLRLGPAPAASDDSSAEGEAWGVVRGQSPGLWGAPFDGATPGNGDYRRYPMAPSGTLPVQGQDSPAGLIPPLGTGMPPATGVVPESLPPLMPTGPDGSALQPFSQPSVDLDIYAEEARTGRFMFGAGVNSDLGVTGQFVVDERNFDPFRFPTSWEDIVNGTAWRGNGQGFRLEAMPGSQVHRYLVTHTVPYFYLPGIPEPFVLSTSGFFFNRRYFDWDEQRVGGRVALGYRVTPDLSLTGTIRGENVKIFDPRIVGVVPQLDSVLGDSDLFSGRLTLTHDTRDNAFLATQGHLIELSYEQTFGSFDYPRGELDYRQYFLMRERPDGSGRHTLAYSFRFGVSGSQTPLFENYFTGGFSTLRGFDFRGASPLGAAGVIVGGRFRFLGSVEYFFPLTADDMIKAVFFCDFGTTEEEIDIHADNYRVSPGFGLRINIPAMGPAPLALDWAVPVAHAPGDNIQNFSFFFGFSR
jgi:outer membrane protein insertion porin family